MLLHAGDDRPFDAGGDERDGHPHVTLGGADRAGGAALTAMVPLQRNMAAVVVRRDPEAGLARLAVGDGVLDPGQQGGVHHPPDGAREIAGERVPDLHDEPLAVLLPPAAPDGPTWAVRPSGRGTPDR